jgi:hypothetical protein
MLRAFRSARIIPAAWDRVERVLNKHDGLLTPDLGLDVERVPRIGPRERHVVEDRVHLAIAIDDIADAERRHAHRHRPEYADAGDDEKHQCLATGFQTFSISWRRDDLPPIGTIAGMDQGHEPGRPGDGASNRGAVVKVATDGTRSCGRKRRWVVSLEGALALSIPSIR